MIKKTTTLLLIIVNMLLLGCVENHSGKFNETSKHEAEILNFLIDTMTIPFPLPPPPPKNGSVAPKVNWDSLNKLKMTVVVDTVFFRTKRNFQLPKELKKYQNLIDSINILEEKRIDKNMIKSEEGHNLIFGNSLNDYDGKYSQLISISRIMFNSEKNVAAVYARHSTHPLASYLGFFLLEKNNGKWIIKFKDVLEVS